MYHRSFLDELSKTTSQLQKMIDKGREQQMINMEIFDTLLILVNEIKVLVHENQPIPFELVKKWNNFYGKIFRAFEGSDIEISLDKITEIINLKKN